MIRLSSCGMGVLSLVLFGIPAMAADSAGNIPDLSGLWARQYFFGFEPPETGHGPIANRSRLPSGQSNPDQFVGDYSDPILKPAAAEILKRRGEITLSGTPFPDPNNQCSPQQVAYILWQWEIQLVQQKDQVVILYMYDHHVRHVRLNSQHPARLTPSWSGDSIGHYEGDTLVVDTVGVKAGPLSMMDGLGTPQSDAVHVVERYRLIDYDTAIEAEKRGEKDNVRIPSDLVIADGIAVDPDYRGKALQLQFTVEDPNVLTMAWSAAGTFRRAKSPWVEYVCADNPYNFGGLSTHMPTAEKPDF